MNTATLASAAAPVVCTRTPPRSIYERALGRRAFGRLHPQIRERFGFSSVDRRASVGRGVMDEVWRGPAYTLPFLYLGAWRNIMFPEHGRDIPFTIENYAYVDRFGRETVTWVRTFQTRIERRFDATMIFSEQRKRIVDYLGSHQHLAVDLSPSVSACGGIRFRSGAQRFYERSIAFSFPMLFSGTADVHEWFDEELGRFRIEVDVRNKALGRLFGYRGLFHARTLHGVGPEDVPAHVRPVREECRE